MVTAKSEAGMTRAGEEIPHDHLFKVTGLSSTNLEKLAQGKIFLYFDVIVPFHHCHFNPESSTAEYYRPTFTFF